MHRDDDHNRREDSNGARNRSSNITKPNANNSRTNFTILNKYLVQTYGSILRKATYIPFIQDMLKFGEESQLGHSSLENGLEGENDVSVNISTDVLGL